MGDKMKGNIAGIVMTIIIAFNLICLALYYILKGLKQRRELWEEDESENNNSWNNRLQGWGIMHYIFFFVFIIGGYLLVLGKIPVRNYVISNIWVRFAGTSMLIGSIIITTAPVNLNWIGVALFLASPLFLAGAVIKSMTDRAWFQRFWQLR